MNYAASVWMKWDEKSPLCPSPGEWCLWTMVIKGKRNYFAGSLARVDDRIFLIWDGFTSFEPDDTVYYARVNFLKEESR